MAREKKKMQLIFVESNITALKILLKSFFISSLNEIAGDLIKRVKLYIRYTNVFLQNEGFATYITYF